MDQNTLSNLSSFISTVAQSAGQLQMTQPKNVVASKVINTEIPY